MAQNQQFDLLKQMVEYDDKMFAEECQKARERDKISQFSPKIPNDVCNKVLNLVDRVLTDCKNDIEQNFDDFFLFIEKRAKLKHYKTKMFSMALYPHLVDLKNEREENENDI